MTKTYISHWKSYMAMNMKKLIIKKIECISMATKLIALTFLIVHDSFRLGLRLGSKTTKTSHG